MDLAGKYGTSLRFHVVLPICSQPCRRKGLLHSGSSHGLLAHRISCSVRHTLLPSGSFSACRKTVEHCSLCGDHLSDLPSKPNTIPLGVFGEDYLVSSVFLPKPYCLYRITLFGNTIRLLGRIGCILVCKGAGTGGFSIALRSALGLCYFDETTSCSTATALSALFFKQSEI